ncbi:MAG: hypothetical protein Q8P21_01360 [bacterium]|nr:hypothetical protein [bacterium]
MKKYYLPILSIAVFALGASPAFAQDASIDATVETRTVQTETRMKANADLRAEAEARRAEAETRRAEADARREAKRVEAEARRASSTAKRVEFQQGIAKRKVENTARVILATIERLEKIIVRIESRIDKVEARGGVTTETEAFVAAARANLSEARVTVEAFANIDLSGDQARENFERIRAAAREAREDVRTAHQNLMMAVRTLGSVEGNAGANASTTTTVQ